MIGMPVSKVVPLAELAALVPDGASVALGGSFLHRGPFALVRELIRRRRASLEIVKQSPGYDIDILCRAGAVARVRAGIVAMEGHLGLAPAYRRAVERQEIELEEHACMTLTAGLRESPAARAERAPCAGRTDRVARSGRLGFVCGAGCTNRWPCEIVSAHRAR